MDEKPLIGVSMGDPAGIGPEIIIKSLINKEIKSKYRIIIFGNKKVIENEVKKYSIKISIIKDKIEDTFDEKKNKYH